MDSVERQAAYGRFLPVATVSFGLKVDSQKPLGESIQDALFGTEQSLNLLCKSVPASTKASLGETP
ncbi:hypothetical protein PS710_06444 [Pseudomonas fluorescens]|uniref:Uncharacterized protein n=1 Tax=Pseudomonas fluorescens TaxID=294 RepID=A0A5E7G2D6_PSEFL|nr:hypothetical protein PS710_06444 [Pseudomonas fluorescens]